MNAGVDHQPASAPHFVGQAPHHLFGRVIEAHLLAQKLRVERPAFDIGGEAGEIFAEGRQRQFLLQGDLVVMARHRFMRGERRQFPEGPLVQLRRIDPIGARNAGLRRARSVISGRRAFRFRRRDGLEAIGQARQRAEIARQQPVDRLGLPRRDAQQFLGRLGIIGRIGAQMLDVSGAAGIAGLRRDRVHALADARHFVQTDLVNLVGRQVGGGVRLHPAGIPGRAAGQRRCAVALAAMGQIIGHEQLVPFAIFGGQHVADQRHRPRLHRRPVGIADVARLGALEGFVEARLARLARHDAADRAGVILQHRTGLDIAAGDRLARDRERIAIHFRIEGEARQIALIIGAIIEGQAIGHARKTLMPAIIGGEEHQPLGRMPVAVNIVAQHPQQHIAVDPVRGVQPLFGHRLQPANELLFRRDLRVARGQRHVGNAIVIVAHAARGRFDRMSRQIPGPMILYHPRQLRLWRRGGRRLRGQRRGGEKQGREA